VTFLFLSHVKHYGEKDSLNIISSEGKGEEDDLKDQEINR
jgi:hypothetical protein